MKPLLCTIYKGSRERELYLYVERSRGLEPVPEVLLARMGTLKEVMTLKLTPERKLARVEAATVLRELEQKGYFLQLPPRHPELARLEPDPGVRHG